MLKTQVMNGLLTLDDFLIGLFVANFGQLLVFLNICFLWQASLGCIAFGLPATVHGCRKPWRGLKGDTKKQKYDNVCGKKVVNPIEVC